MISRTIDDGRTTKRRALCAHWGGDAVIHGALAGSAPVLSDSLSLTKGQNVKTIKNVRWLFVGTLLISSGCQDGASVDPSANPPAEPPQAPQGDPGPVFAGPE